MGAAVDVEMKNKLSVTLIAARNTVARAETPADSPENVECADTSALSKRRHVAAVQNDGPSTPSLSLHQREQSVSRHGRARRVANKLLQTQLPLAIISKGRFDKSEPTIHKGEDLDIPTYVRRGVALN
jgi:hypothetical protein